MEKNCSVSGEGSVERDRFAVGIGDDDLLRAGVEGGRYDQESVGVLECNTSGFSIHGDGRAALKAAAANGESGACCENSCGRDRADSQGNGGKLNNNSTSQTDGQRGIRAS